MAEQTPIEMLKSDHQKVESMFGDFAATEKTDAARRKSIADSISLDLKVHTRLEEEVFYPEVAKVSDEGRSLIDDSIGEHNEIKELVKDVESLDAEDDEFEKKMNMLEEAVTHHVNEEERMVFPFADQYIANDMGAGMTAKMMAIKGKDMTEETVKEL